MRTRLVTSLSVIATVLACQDGARYPVNPNVAVVRANIGSPEVTLLDLGTFGEPDANASGINEHGEVVGITLSPGNNQAFLWSRRSGFLDLGTLGGLNAGARDINARGQIVGSSRRAESLGGRPSAFLWTSKDGMRDLLPDHPERTVATAINDNGDVVGTLGFPRLSTFSPFYPRAYLWSERDGVTELGWLPGGTGSIAHAINEGGDVVGEASAGPGASEIHGFLWSRNDGMKDLGYLGPVPSNESFIRAGLHGINNAGTVVGTRCFVPCSGSQTRAVIWTAAEGMTELLPPGALGSAGLGMNDREEVVGVFLVQVPDGPPGFHTRRPFLWTRASGFTELPHLTDRETYAVAISEAGAIVGTSRAPTDEYHAVIWTPRGPR